VKSIVSHITPYLRWFVLGATLLFLGHTLHQHWQDVTQIRLQPRGLLWLAAALAVTGIAHTWSGWVWGWLLQAFNAKVNLLWATRVFLKTNIAKYLPGNIWHFYGRIREGQKAQLSTVAVTASVILEPLLMAAAAVPVVMWGLEGDSGIWPLLGLAVVLVGIHPRCLNPVLHRAATLKLKGQPLAVDNFSLKCYPLRPLLGELGFLGFRSAGFVLAWLAIAPVSMQTLPQLVGGFSLAWLLGLVVPGAPGGVGVLEATAVAVLEETFPVGSVLAAVALYRFISVTAEAGGAGLAVLAERWTPPERG
jgi:hypothetical protein